MFGNTVGGFFTSQAPKIKNLDFFFETEKEGILSEIDRVLAIPEDVDGLFIWADVQKLFGLPNGYWLDIADNGHTPRSRAILRYLRNHVEKYG